MRPRKTLFPRNHSARLTMDFISLQKTIHDVGGKFSRVTAATHACRWSGKANGFWLADTHGHFLQTPRRGRARGPADSTQTVGPHRGYGPHPTYDRFVGHETGLSSAGVALNRWVANSKAGYGHFFVGVIT